MTSATLTRRAIAPLLVAGATLLLSACGGAGTDSAPSSEAGTTSVVAAFYPLQYAAQAVGGDTVSVTSLTPPGVEPHDLELTAAQVAEISQADVVLYIKGFQPAVDEAVAQQAADRAIDVSEGLALLSGDPAEGEINDPHVWLDPLNMQVMTKAVELALAAARPAEANGFSLRAMGYQNSLAALDEEFNAGLAECANRYVVTGHEAFGYLAAAYGLTQESIAGISPGDEPSARTLEEVSAFVREHDITTIFFEENLPDDLSRTVADETGASTSVLNTVETLSDDQVNAGDTYISVMRDNLAALRAALRCT